MAGGDQRCCHYVHKLQVYHIIPFMDPYFYNRIDYKGPIDNILKKVCEDFELGKYASHELIPFGYEDFNVRLNTDQGSFFVKMFGSYRSKAECKQYVHIMELVYQNKIHYPYLYSSNQGHLYEIHIEESTVRLVVQQFIEGQNFLQLQEKPVTKERKIIIQQALLISQINFKPRPVYDSWGIANFEKEFYKKAKFLPDEFKDSIKTLLDQFLTVSLKKLPHSFVHGDIILSNIMRENGDKIYVLDFAVSQYYPRIFEIVALICFNFFEPDKLSSLNEAYTFTLKEYQKRQPLTGTEIVVLPLIIEVAFAMYLMSANYEKIANENNRVENEYWIKVGICGLSASKSLLV